MRAPNFFLVGAPKSGTTAMADYLAENERIFFCKPKEPCYFADDFPGQRMVDTEEDYLALFDEAGDRHLAVGEGTVWYLYSARAIQNIRDFDRDAKIIVMLRNPVEQVYSMHQELFHRRYEVEPDFATAWRLQEKRRGGESIPRYCKASEFLQYSAIASYSGQVERLLRIFPREQVRIIVFDDFKRNAGQVYRDTLEFLGVPDDGRVDFSPALESRRHRFRWLGTFLINQPPWMINTRSRIKRALGIQRIGLQELVARHNTVIEKRRPLPPEFLSELKDHFRSDVERLSSLLDRDLTGWTS